MLHTLRIVNSSGDREVSWSPEDAAAVKAAMNEFDDIRRKGYMVVQPDAAGGKPTMITRFDATAPELVAIPAIIGG